MTDNDHCSEVSARELQRQAEFFNTKIENVLTLIKGNDANYNTQFSNAKESVNVALLAQEKAVDVRFESVTTATNAALHAADKATSKAEEASNKRFEGVNEFRATLSDQAAHFIIRTEFDLVVTRLEQDIKNLALAKLDMLSIASYEAAHKDLQHQVEELRLSRANLEGRATTTSVYVAYFFSVLGILLGIVGLLMR